MALITKTIRCATCGSTAVTVDGKNYICADCGARNDHPMSAADLAAVNRITMLGGDSQELERLRKQYRNLDVTSWSSENRLQGK